MDIDRPGPLLEIDIVADVACPWSYIGKRQLDRALASVTGPTKITWHPFQLNPDVPRGGMPLDELLRQRFGDPGSVQPALRKLEALGRRLDIRYDFNRLQRVPNTIDAHRVMSLARRRGVQHALAEQLYAGLFERELDLEDREVLVSLGEAAGLSAEEVRGTLDDRTSEKLVLAEEAEARGMGIASVPAYLVNQRLLVPGAQDSRVLLAAIDQAMFPSLLADQTPTVH